MNNNDNNLHGSYSYEDNTNLYGQPIYPDTSANQNTPQEPYTPPNYGSSYSSQPYHYNPSWYQPSYSSYSTPKQQPPVPPTTAGTPKKRKAPRIIASALAIMLLSGAAGGGAAYWVLQNGAAPSASVAPSQVEPSVAATTYKSTGETGVTSVVKKSASSVVEITTEAAAQNPFAMQYVEQQAGSGVIYTEDGFIITNNHVIDGADSILVRTQDGTEYNATLVGTDSKTDLAVLKIEATGLHAATLANSDSLEVGQLAVAIGNPLGELGGTVTSGIISATGREISIGTETMHLLQTSAAVNPGNSGGGLFDQNGDLVGIVNAKSTGVDVEGLGFAIPSNQVKEVVDDIMQNGYVTGRPEMGISIVDVADLRTAASYNLNELGVYVASVNRENGLQVGDRIISADDTAIRLSSDVRAALSQHKPGETIRLVVARDGQEITVEVALTEQVPQSVKEKM
ncbi:trypsin-like peptidase domain-containing protein [Oscillospiraceae bacterium MB08-C2-2]|nr:trypsin-like peptidase domain-containing protein [Oscillospiraceae bacterium MB08-C2-2]